MKEKLRPLFTIRFLKFCTVGASGVVVNLGLLLLFAEVMSLHVNLASALAIEFSVNTNFLINELWTFRDRRSGLKGGFARRWLRFHLVSLGGAVLQWGVFIMANIFWLLTTNDWAIVEQYFASGSGWIENYLIHPISDPPDVGNLKYISQLFGIGAAVFWNYFANFHWTWNRKAEKTNG
jgi:putative flippase GtrA